MTTIACDGRSIASDTQATAGDERTSTTKRKIVVENGFVYGFTGVCSYFEAVRKWHANGCDPDNMPKTGKDDRWNLLVFGPDGVRCYSQETPYFEEYEYPQAFGSGASYALGAMKAGAAAHQAVQIAIELDIRSGGHVKVISLEDAFRVAEAQRGEAGASKMRASGLGLSH